MPDSDKDKELSPIAPARAAEELRKLSAAYKAGELKADEYEHRFSRTIQELRDRRISGSRAEIMASLEPLRLEGAVTPAEWDRFVSQLGLA